MEQKSSRKLPSTAFVKGRSGNPGGRPKKSQEEYDLIAAAKAKTPEAFEVMASIMANGSSDKVRLSAAQAIIERAYGKPKQEQDVNLVGDLTLHGIKVEFVSSKK